MKRKEFAVLFAIFLITFGARMYFAFSTPYFSSDEAYFSLRQIEHIRATDMPLYEDPLSFSGRSLVFPPLYDYILAIISSVTPLMFALKFFPNLFASSLVFLSYLIAKKMTRNGKIALFTAFISSFVPVYFAKTVNSISPYSLVVPIIFLLMYSFMNLDKTEWVYCYIISVVVLAFMHPAAILFVVGMLFYLVLTKVEGLKTRKLEVEAVLFATFFVILAEFMMFKKVFLFHGPYVIWQNMPKQMLSKFFAGTTIIGAVYRIGIVPFFSGIYVTYKHLFQEKKHYVYLLLSFALGAGILLWTRLIEVDTGMIFLGLVFVLLFSQFLKEFFEYVQKTKFSRYTNAILVILIIIFIFSSVLPSFSYASQIVSQSVTDEDVMAFVWVRQNTPKNSVIAATVEEGNMITAIAERKNIMDSNFLYIRDAEQRYSDLQRIFTTISQTEAISVLNKYNADYVYFSPKATKKYNARQLSYIDENCFTLVYSKGTKIYRLECRLEEI